MPIVISHGDVAALGALAQAAGYNPAYAQASARRSELNTAMLAQMDQRDLQQQQLLAQERQANLDRQQKGALANLNATLDREQMAAQDDRFGRQLEAQKAEREDTQTFTLARDEQQRQAQLQEIEARKQAELEIQSQKQGSRYGTSPGLPNEKQVDAELEAFGNLIPFGAATSSSPMGAARAREDTVKTAKSLTGLPTGQLQAFIQAQPKSPWVPYLQAILKNRGVEPAGAVGTPGAPGSTPKPSGAAAGQPTAAGGGLGAGQGYATDPRLQALTNEQLMELARNPDALRRMLQ